MAISLYELSVSSFLQTLGGVDGFLGKGLAHFKEKGIDPNEVVKTRLAADMLPFQFQVVSIVQHSLGAMRAVKAGLFTPPHGGPTDYEGLQKIVAEAREALQALTPDEVNALEGNDMIFQLGERKLPFIVKDFLLTFSLPNFHFHAATAYDILRLKGVPLGKRDYLGRMRLKG
ncbi:MAG: DUF1993 domain-containing protein [Alphaproteobacteria bacterium]|nr:DUF1993 domain-containing protein [Alphaproteobacteria bacterium]